MRISSVSLASLVVLGCSCSSDTRTNAGPPATLTISSDLAPVLVAFRDGVDAAWQPATMTSAMAFEAVVHGPYVVAIVCLDAAAPGPAPFTFVSYTAQTPDDARELIGCGAPPVTHQVTGLMVQPGSAQLGGVSARSSMANWTFELAIESGTYDLVATTDQAISVRRDIAVTADMALTPAVDLGVDGTALVDVAFSAPNAAADETASVSVGLLGARNEHAPARIYLGPLATGKAAPDSALVASDVQSASVRANKGTALRALRKPFRVGGDAAYTLPPAIGGAAFSIDGGQLTAHWTTLPPLGVVLVSAGGNAPASAAQVSQGAVISAQFVQATGVSEFTLDTDMPGYKPAWQVSFTAPYSRDLTVQLGTEVTALATSEFTEFLDMALAVDGPAPAAAMTRGMARLGALPP